MKMTVLSHVQNDGSKSCPFVPVSYTPSIPPPPKHPCHYFPSLRNLIIPMYHVIFPFLQLFRMKRASAKACRAKSLSFAHQWSTREVVKFCLGCAFYILFGFLFQPLTARDRLVVRRVLGALQEVCWGFIL
jgi:hypothetical protein